MDAGSRSLLVRSLRLLTPVRVYPKYIQPPHIVRPFSTNSQQTMSSSQPACSDPVGKYLTRSLSERHWSVLGSISSLMGWSRARPPPRPVDLKNSIVWLLDNTAYRPVSPDQPTRPGSWHAEVIACIFQRADEHEIGKFVAAVTDYIGMDGEVGTDKVVRQRIASRLRPFLDHTVPNRLATLEIPLGDNSTQSHTIGPSDRSGVICQDVCTGDHYAEDGTRTQPYLQGTDAVSMDTIFSAPEGWLVMSDIDDTVKITRTYEDIGMLQTTFAEEPQPVDGMPELYSHIQRELLPTWFYVSASPYNLYPFLHKFLHTHYCHGTMILRDTSWRNLASLFASLTERTEEFKVDRAEKLHRWFPCRRAVCIGDSTQRDPEAYAEIYKRHPDWVQAIFIRKVTGHKNMEDRNKPERFKEAFKHVPNNIWRIFEHPDEVYKLVEELGTRDTAWEPTSCK